MSTAPTAPAPSRRKLAIRVGPRLAGGVAFGSPSAQAQEKRRGRPRKHVDTAIKQKEYRARKQAFIEQWKAKVDLRNWEAELAKLKKAYALDAKTEAALENWRLQVLKLRGEQVVDRETGGLGAGPIMKGAPRGLGLLVTGGFGPEKISEVDAAHQRDEQLGGKRNKKEGAGKDEDEPSDSTESVCEDLKEPLRPGFIYKPKNQIPERQREKSARLEIEVQKVIEQNSHVIHGCRVCSFALEGRDEGTSSKYRQLFDHIMEQHPEKIFPETWIQSVYYCHFENGKKGCCEIFDNESDLSAHMQQVHGRAFRRAQRALRKKPIPAQPFLQPPISFTSEAEINVLRALDEMEAGQMGLGEEENESEDQPDYPPAQEEKGELKPIS